MRNVLDSEGGRAYIAGVLLHRQVKEVGAPRFRRRCLTPIGSVHGGHRPVDADDRTRGASARFRARARQAVWRHVRSHASGDGRAPGHAPAQDRRLRRSVAPRSEEHPSELQSLMRISSAVFCFTKKKERKTLIKIELTIQ